MAVRPTEIDASGLDCRGLDEREKGGEEGKESCGQHGGGGEVGVEEVKM